MKTIRFWIKIKGHVGEKWESIDIEVEDNFPDEDETQISNLALGNTINSFHSYEIL